MFVLAKFLTRKESKRIDSEKKHRVESAAVFVFLLALVGIFFEQNMVVGQISGDSLDSTTPTSSLYFARPASNSVSRSGYLLDSVNSPVKMAGLDLAYRPDDVVADYSAFGNVDGYSDDIVLPDQGALGENGVYRAEYEANGGYSGAVAADEFGANGYPATTYDHWAEGKDSAWEAHFLPLGEIYPSYLAGRKEPRFQTMFTNDKDYGWLWDISLGGRFPLFRYGTSNPIEPEGFQIDAEGAALLRLDFERERSLAATDYRAGLPLSYGTTHWQYKLAYYHVSSHLGDNYLLDKFRKKVHYVRDEIVIGVSFKPISSIRLYAEAGWAFHTGKTTDPWEFQFGAEFSPVYNPVTAKQGTPFAAVNGHLFEELDFGGYLNVQIGWQWRNAINGRLRIGGEFYDGCDDQFQFHSFHQQKAGVGLWYDF